MMPAGGRVPSADTQDGRVILQVLTKLGADGWRLFKYMSEDSAWPYGVFLLERRLEATAQPRRPFTPAVGGTRSTSSRPSNRPGSAAETAEKIGVSKRQVEGRRRCSRTCCSSDSAVRGVVQVRETAVLVLHRAGDAADKDQLPSVGPGSVLRDLVGCERVPLTLLTVAKIGVDVAPNW
jgi:hypothetical protein